MNRQTGLTLIEMMITVAILAIIVTLAVPSFNDMINRQRLSGTTDSIYADLQLARSEAIKRNVPISLALTTTGSSWCYAITDTPPCACNACSVGGVASKVTSSADYKNVSFTSDFPNNTITFSPPRGMPDSNGTYTMTISGTTYTVVVDALGFPKINK